MFLSQELSLGCDMKCWDEKELFGVPVPAWTPPIELKLVNKGGKPLCNPRLYN